MPAAASGVSAEGRQRGRIPIRNLWLLMLYASDLIRSGAEFKALVEDDLDNLPDLVARLLVNTVERRLRRNLTRGYCHKQMPLTRVRGRIDILTTEARQLLAKGEVFCRFADLSNDTPRNRLVRAALYHAGRLHIDKETVHRCRSLADDLGEGGVGGLRPSRADLSADQIGRNDAADRTMVALARLVFDLALPTEESGYTSLFAPDREEAWMRRLFEKAVLGFSRVEFEPLGWSVRGGGPLQWQVSESSPGLATVLPRMVTDIAIDAGDGLRLVIDTKFTSILVSGRFGNATIDSGYLYQMFAYLRSQEGRGTGYDRASGLLLYPAIDTTVREHTVIQGHRIVFGTVDLARGAMAIRQELRDLIHFAIGKGIVPETVVTIG